MRYIGSMNEWPMIVWSYADGSTRIEKNDTTPQEYKDCVNAGHKTREVKKGHCWYNVFCDTCGISWDYDCSD